VGFFALNSSPEEFLERAAACAADDPVELSVRDLIGHWNARGRGSRVVERIRHDLKAHGLLTEPDFAAWSLDARVRLTVAGAAREFLNDAGVDESEPEALRLQLGNIASASRGVVAASPFQELTVATTTMILNDFSQLAVLEGERTLRGAITWESIGQGLMRGGVSHVRELTVPAEPVAHDADVLDLVPRIVSDGFVFVRGADARITGIVTTADLSEEFVELARPFFLLGEIERRFRRIVDLALTPMELATASDPDDVRPIVSAADLTLGELERILQRPDNWERLGFGVDRGTFLNALARTREIRNEVMHFSPDPPGTEDVKHLLGFLRLLRHVGE
jgi:predicted transcriptional regulator